MLIMDTKIPATLWKAQLLRLVNEAPKASCVENNSLVVENRTCSSSGSGSTVSSSSGSDEGESPFGRSFFPFISPYQLQELLVQDGQFLVRKNHSYDLNYILSLRFNGKLKNFVIRYDESNGFIYNESNKAYGSLMELVQEGLVTLYLDLKAGAYIDLMVDLTQFHLSHSKSSINSSLQTGTVGTYRKINHESSPTPTSLSSNSSLQRSLSGIGATESLKSHIFSIHTFEKLSRCDICLNYLWGTSSQGFRCRDCHLSVHENCLEKVETDCVPDLSQLPKIFGEDLTIVSKGSGPNEPPFIIKKCIIEIERRGLHIEGIYRVSGSKELIERLKNKFEKERLNTDLSELPDIHSMCCIVKLYFRLLPQPLITSDVFQKFLSYNGTISVEMIEKSLRKLPLSHQLSLKILLIHLYRVASRSDKNKMTPFNLSSVFTPSIICPNEISLNTLKIGTTVLELLITNVPYLYPSSSLSHLNSPS